MNRFARSIGRFAVVLLIAGVAAPAAAQTPTLEIGAGYQTSHIPDNWNPLGFNVDVAVTTMDKFSVVGEVGLTRDSENAAGIVNATLKDWNFGGGVRYSGRMAPLSGYFQLLAGGLHRSFDLDTLDVIGIGDSTTEFMLQPGVGITYDLMPNTGLKVDLAYRRVFFENEGENQFRVAAGIQIGFPR